MLWSYITPLYMTIMLCLSMFLWLWLKKGIKRALVRSLVYVVPIFLLSKCSYNFYVFRVHHFDNAAQVPFDSVKYYVPESAKDLELHLNPGAYYAKYSITPANLENWFNKQKKWANSLSREFSSEVRKANIREFNSTFTRQKWSISKQCDYYEGPIFMDSSGSRIYFDKEAGIAYQFYSFW